MAMAEITRKLTRRAFLGGAAAFGAVSFMMPTAAFADRTSAEVQAEADAARAKLAEMEAKLDDASNRYFAALEERDAALASMEECQTRIEENNQRISQLQDDLSGRARDMYRDGQLTFFDILVGSASFGEFIKNWDMLQRINDQDAAMIAETKSLRADNEAQKEEYEQQAEIAQAKADEAEEAKEEAEALVAQYTAEVESLDAEVAELVEEERRRAAEEQARKEAEERARQEEEERRQQQQQQTTETPSNSNNSNNSNSSNPGTSIPAQGSVVDYAVSQLGVPYVWAGSTPGVGFDCSGLTSWCWQQATGIWIGRTDSAQYGSAHWVGSVSQAQPGDVLWTSGHVGICAESGGGTYIHAPAPGQSVCYSSWAQFSAALRWG